MPQPIRIAIDTSRYKTPTQEEISAARRFILLRNDYARQLEQVIDDLLEAAAASVVTICYKHDVDPTKFTISSRYNEKMMDEIGAVMDELEDEVFTLIEEYSVSVTEDRERRSLLAAWIAMLGRGNRNLNDTLHGYLYKTMKDWEAAVAALRAAGVTLPDAIIKVKSNLHTIYTMPEVVQAFRQAEAFEATYIRSRGVVKGAVGLSNNGSTNVTKMARTTLDMAWMRELYNQYKTSGAEGYYVLRGSSYPCELCDSMVGWHPITDMDGFPLYHANCCCFVIPVNPLRPKNIETSHSAGIQTNDHVLPEELFDVYEDKENGVAFRIAKGIDKNKSDYKDLMKIASEFAKTAESVAILRPYHVNSDEYRKVYAQLENTKYWGKNPDLRIGNNFWEYKSYIRPWNRRKVSNMLSHGLVQSDRIIIDNFDGASDELIKNMIRARLKINDNSITSVYVYEAGGIRPIYKDKVFK